MWSHPKFAEPSTYFCYQWTDVGQKRLKSLTNTRTLTFLCGYICLVTDKSFTINCIQKKQKKKYTIERLLHKSCHAHGFRSCSNEVSVVYWGIWSLDPLLRHHQPVCLGGQHTANNQQDTVEHVTFKDQYLK